MALNCVLVLVVAGLPAAMLFGATSSEQERFSGLPHWDKALAAPVTLRRARLSLPMRFSGSASEEQSSLSRVDLACGELLYRLREAEQVQAQGEAEATSSSSLLCSGGARATTEEGRLQSQRLLYHRGEQEQRLSTRDPIAGSFGRVRLNAEGGMVLEQGQLQVFEKVRMVVEGSWRVEALGRARLYRVPRFWQVDMYEDVRVRFPMEDILLFARGDEGTFLLCPSEGQQRVSSSSISPSCRGQGDSRVHAVVLRGNVVLYNRGGKEANRWLLSAQYLDFSDHRFLVMAPRLRFPNGDLLRGREGRLFLPSGRGIVCGDVQFESAGRSVRGECLRFDLRTQRAKLAGQS